MHSLAPGGSTWQWIRLLERHTSGGGRATIFAADGPLAEPAREAGIEVVQTSWGGNGAPGVASATLAYYDTAIVHCELTVIDALPRALDACGRVALAIHLAPRSDGAL